MWGYFQLREERGELREFSKRRDGACPVSTLPPDNAKGDLGLFDSLRSLTRTAPLGGKQKYLVGLFDSLRSLTMTASFGGNKNIEWDCHFLI